LITAYRVTRDSLSSLLGEAWTIESAYAALRALEADVVPGQSSLFATPVRSDTDLVWEIGPQDAVFRANELSADSQRNLDVRIGRRIGDLRRAIEVIAHTEPERARALNDLLWNAIEIPGREAIHVVGDAPILAAWGHVGRSFARPLRLLAHLDDGVAVPARRRAPWPVWRAAGAALVVMLAAIMAFALFVPLDRLPLPAQRLFCEVTPVDASLLTQRDAERRRESELIRRLTEIRIQVAETRADCPIRVEYRQAPAPTPAQPPPDLPADRWQRRDLAMLEGCWDRITNLSTHDTRTGQLDRVASWRICFDRAGSGRHSVRYESGQTCSGPVRARFGPNEKLIMEDQSNIQCDRNFYIFRANSECTRTNDKEAQCDAIQPENNTRVTAIFRRP
jgi:hypothetical protein